MSGQSPAAQRLQKAVGLHSGYVLFRRGDPFQALYVVRDGALKTSPNGSRDGERLYYPGDVLGLDAVPSGRHRCDATAVAASTVDRIALPRSCTDTAGSEHDDPSLSPQARVLARLLGCVESLAGALAVQRRELDDTNHLARVDSLTGLLNRRGWEEALRREEGRARRCFTPLCVVIVDLDNLKELNDGHGHARGDAVLQRTARLLQSVVRGSDVVARTGGDEFAILCVGCNTTPDRVLAKVERELAGHGITASAGAARWTPELDLPDTVLEADRRMYAMKQERRARRSRSSGRAHPRDRAAV